MSSIKNLSTKPPAELDKDQIKKEIETIKKKLEALQNLLYAEGKHSILVLLQGLDASGKDGAIRNIFSGLNPQGISVTSFKAPTAQELKHDFLWRIHQHCPEKGMIGIFNRSHYEDVLVARVHGWCDDKTAKKRFKAINDFEQLLEEHNDTRVLKFYLHVSPEEQEERLKERMENPAKAWKYNSNDFKEAALRPKYIEAYDDIFENCNQPAWHIVPADKNWYKEYLIAQTLLNALEGLKMQYPSMKETK